MQRDKSNEIDAEAARWVAKIDRAPLPSDEAARLEAWLAGDTRRVGAFARAKAVSVMTDLAAARHGWPSLAMTAAGAKPTVLKNRWIVSGAAAAVLVIAVVVGSFLYPRPSSEMSTGVGEIRRAPLEDGSVIVLNTASMLEAYFDAQSRRVKLLSGEVLFEVAKDPKRPFIVDTGDVEVVAVGTSFVVRRLPDEPVSVLVREGIVDVRPKRGQKAERATADEAVTASAGMPLQIQEMHGAEVTRALAWQQGMINLSDTTLIEAAAQFNRYNLQSISIRDPALEQQRITGLFSVNDPQGFAAAAALSLGAKSGIDADGIWIGTGTDSPDSNEPP